MINVPDVKRTALWYQGIGFTVIGCHGEAEGFGAALDDDGPALDWACLRHGDHHR